MTCCRRHRLRAAILQGRPGECRGVPFGVSPDPRGRGEHGGDGYESSNTYTVRRVRAFIVDKEKRIDSKPLIVTRDAVDVL